MLPKLVMVDKEVDCVWCKGKGWKVGVGHAAGIEASCNMCGGTGVDQLASMPYLAVLPEISPPTSIVKIR